MSRPFRLLSLVVVAPIVLALLVWYAASITRKAREAPPFRAGRDRAEREACHVIAFRIQHS